MSDPKLTLIVAADSAGGIGINNQLPWHLPADLARFKQLTTGHPIIMGRKTFDSIGRPLPNRRNIVITRDAAWQHDKVEAVNSIEAALALVDGLQAYVIGGAQIFEKTLPLAQRLELTEIGKRFDCDVFLPTIDWKQWKEVAREGYHSAEHGFDYAFVTYERVEE
ncbi:dihydrofolate reductase [Noviherbaspirillum humi]|uniref:Dihydrofolate reductase n=1 Tax=Noviherbaspirillum humi TaxID=1688639 RepID=A0A239DEK8_9BURK|nr:dihydrofolate reductase [Noviherbaspirillum humi]SNS30906.1 dihydrofolate reductase [Noviherbaspirillum humi]